MRDMCGEREEMDMWEIVALTVLNASRPFAVMMSWTCPYKTLSIFSRNIFFWVASMNMEGEVWSLQDCNFTTSLSLSHGKSRYNNKYLSLLQHTSPPATLVELTSVEHNSNCCS